MLLLLLVQEGGTEGWITFLPLYAREFPYSMQTLFDNTLDPAHVPWSHHGVIGNRDKASPLDLQVGEGERAFGKEAGVFMKGG